MTSQFNLAAGLSPTHIPYKGAAPLNIDIASGVVWLKPIVVVSGKHSPDLPEVPTAFESGLNVELYTEYGLFAPARTPRAILDLIQHEVHAVLQVPEMQKFLADTAQESSGMPVSEYQDKVRKDFVDFARYARDAGLKLE